MKNDTIQILKSKSYSYFHFEYIRANISLIPLFIGLFLAISSFPHVEVSIEILSKLELIVDHSIGIFWRF